jgi:hypothetical protein
MTVTRAISPGLVLIGTWPCWEANIGVRGAIDSENCTDAVSRWV